MKTGCAERLSWKPGGNIHVSLSKLNNPVKRLNTELIYPIVWCVEGMKKINMINEIGGGERGEAESTLECMMFI